MAADGPSHQARIHGSLTWRYSGDGNWPIALSTPERAVLKLLDELPGGETFHQIDILIEDLAGLSPKRAIRLLGNAEASR